MNPTEPTLGESMSEVLKQVPAPIREFLTGPERNRILSELSAKYGLHVDQAAIFENQFISMLLGLVEPEEFMSALQAAGVEDAVVTSLAQDLNTEVFVPIRAKMEAPPPQQAAVAKPTTPVVPVAKAMPPPPENLPGVIQPKAPMPPQAKPVFAASFAKPGDSPAVHAGVKPSQPQATQASGLAGALKAAGVPLLEDHEEPHIELKKAAPPPAPAPRVIPTTMPIAPRMQAMPAAPAPKPITPPAIAPIPAPQQQAPVKSYAVDPYREQPDENEK